MEHDVSNSGDGDGDGWDSGPGRDAGGSGDGPGSADGDGWTSGGWDLGSSGGWDAGTPVDGDGGAAPASGGAGTPAGWGRASSASVSDSSWAGSEPGGTASILAAEAPALAPESPPPISEARRHWWSPLPLPPLPPISARRGYTEVLLVFGAFFLAGILGAGLLLAGRYQNPFQNGSWSDYGPEMVDIVAQTALAVAVVLLLSARRGVTAGTLGLNLPRRRDGRFAAGQATRILAWAIFAQVIGGIINAALQTGHLPTSQPNAAELVFATFDSIQAGVVEELVVLAFVVVTLRQAGRGWWEITLVALVLRGSYHIYYGPGVVGILVWALLFYWIYLRFRSLILLMICHAAWDTVGFLSQRWPAVVGGAVLVAAAIWVAAPITWLIERNAPEQDLAWSPGPGPGPAPAPSTPPWQPSVAPPGWQPDPAGMHYWRWWDGQRWTDYVSGP